MITIYATSFIPMFWNICEYTVRQTCWCTIGNNSCASWQFWSLTSKWHPRLESSLMWGQNPSDFVFFLLWFSALMHDVFMPYFFLQKGSLICPSPAYLFFVVCQLSFCASSASYLHSFVLTFSLSCTFLLIGCLLHTTTTPFACPFGGQTAYIFSKNVIHCVSLGHDIKYEHNVVKLF